MQKLVDFGKRLWGNIKSGFQKVAPVVKQVLPFISPLLPGGEKTGEIIKKGIDFAAPILGSGFQPSASRPSNVSSFNPIASKPILDSPRIRLRGVS